MTSGWRRCRALFDGGLPFGAGVALVVVVLVGSGCNRDHDPAESTDAGVTTTSAPSETSTTGPGQVATTTSSTAGGSKDRTTTTTLKKAAGSTTTSTTSGGTTTTTVLTGTVRLTNADKGRQLVVGVGTRVEVSLDGSAPDHAWVEPWASNPRMRRDSADAQVTGDASAVFTAVGRGEVRIQDEQQCPPGRFCAVPESWYVDFEVV